MVDSTQRGLNSLCVYSIGTTCMSNAFFLLAEDRKNVLEFCAIEQSVRGTAIVRDCHRRGTEGEIVQESHTGAPRQSLPPAFHRQTSRARQKPH